MKSSTVDLVVTGEERAALAAGMDAVRRGQRVLVVVRAGGARAMRRVRRRFRRGANGANVRVRVMTNSEIVCVDGVDGVEAVVIRHARTGRLSAVNASAFLVATGVKCVHARKFCATATNVSATRTLL